MRGCTTIDYTPPAQQTITGDKSCFIFNVSGAGVIYQDDLGLDDCSLTGGSLTSLNVGEKCGSMIYAGVSSGRRIYIHHIFPALGSQYSWGQLGTPAANTLVGANSSTDGLYNTEKILAMNLQTPAATYCRSLGSKWYLPAPTEMLTLWSNAGTGELAGIFLQSIDLWTSREHTTNGSFIAQRFSTSLGSSAGLNKHNNRYVVCMRRD